MEYNCPGVELLGRAGALVDGIIINASLYKYTSYAISTSLKPASIPAIDVRFSAITSNQDNLKN